MSILIRDLQNNQVTLYSKGADDVIFRLLSPKRYLSCSVIAKKYIRSSGMVLDQTKNSLRQFANHGLRTIVLAKKIVPEEEAMKLAQRLHEAKGEMSDRIERITEVAAELEINLELIGVTAIEDRPAGQCCGYNNFLIEGWSEGLDAYGR